jgi:hypothetical protein
MRVCIYTYIRLNTPTLNYKETSTYSQPAYIHIHIHTQMMKVLRLNGNLPDELAPGGVWTAKHRPKSLLYRWYPDDEDKKKRQKKRVCLLFMCISMYMCLYSCMYVCICVCVCVCVWLMMKRKVGVCFCYVYTRMNTHVTYTHVHKCMCTTQQVRKKATFATNWGRQGGRRGSLEYPTYYIYIYIHTLHMMS